MTRLYGRGAAGPVGAPPARPAPVAVSPTTLSPGAPPPPPRPPVVLGGVVVVGGVAAVRAQAIAPDRSSAAPSVREVRFMTRPVDGKRGADTRAPGPW